MTKADHFFTALLRMGAVFDKTDAYRQRMMDYAEACIASH
jgi:hypothetical protein